MLYPGKHKAVFWQMITYLAPTNNRNSFPAWCNSQKRLVVTEDINSILQHFCIQYHCKAEDKNNVLYHFRFVNAEHLSFNSYISEKVKEKKQETIAALVMKDWFHQASKPFCFIQVCFPISFAHWCKQKSCFGNFFPPIFYTITNDDTTNTAFSEVINSIIYYTIGSAILHCNLDDSFMSISSFELLGRYCSKSTIFLFNMFLGIRPQQ